MPAPNAPSPPAGCTQEPITTRVLSESILFLDYESPEQFYLCLSDSVLQTDLEHVLEQPLTTEYLWVLKKRLQEVRGEPGHEQRCNYLGRGSQFLL